MPTYDQLPQFRRDFAGLARELRARFSVALDAFIDDLRDHPGQFRPGLRVKRVRALEGVWEMTFAPDGRATFKYGEPVHPGDVHIIWRRIGGHEIFERP